MARARAGRLNGKRRNGPGAEQSFQAAKNDRRQTPNLAAPLALGTHVQDTALAEADARDPRQRRADRLAPGKLNLLLTERSFPDDLGKHARNDPAHWNHTRKITRTGRDSCLLILPADS